MTTKMLQQDVATRWNSTFYIMRSLLDQKRALNVFGAEHELPSSFTTHQWGLTENMVTLLAPFEQLTREISSHRASAADVIRFVVALKRLLSKEAETDSGVLTAKRTLLQTVNDHFENAFSEPLYHLATILDPRYKDHYFDRNTKQVAINMLQKEVERMMRSNSDTATEKPKQEDSGEQPQQKKTCAESDGGEQSLLDMYDEILEEEVDTGGQAGLTSPTVVQVC